MAYAQVDGDGTIISFFANPQPGNDAVTFVSDHDPRLLAFISPAESREALAAAALAQRISAGIAVTFLSTPLLNSTFALDDMTLNQLGSVARDFAAGLGLPGGGDAFGYPDATGNTKAMTGAQIVALYKAQRDLLFILDRQAALMAHGGTPDWPLSQSAVII